MYGASDRRSVSAGHFRSNDLLEARESARAGNESFEFTQLGRCRRAQRACNVKAHRREVRAFGAVPCWAPMDTKASRNRRAFSVLN